MAQSGFTPISIYYSSTATNVPTAGNLVAGELAINTADGKLFYKDSAGVVQVIGTKGGVGSSTTTQVLYNSSGLVVGSANMTFSGTALTLANDASISGLTVGKGGGAVSSNTALGVNTLALNTVSSENVAIGSNALANADASGNTAVGRLAMQFTTSGSQNSALGLYSLRTNTTGQFNVALGSNALYSNTTASNNTAVGYQAAYSNVTGEYITAIGYLSLASNTGGYNTAIGGLALTANTTGTGNVAGGLQSMQSNTTGGNNTANGNLSLKTNTTGGSNTAFGNSALYSNTTASNNTAVGYQAGYSGTTGNSNVIFGYQAGYTGTTAAGSVFVGYQTGYSVTGSNNTFLGNSAGYSVTSGAKNTIIGQYGGNQGGLDIRTASNYIVLSDGDGNPRGIFDGSGNFIIGTTSQIASAKQTISFPANTQNGLDISDSTNTTNATFCVFSLASSTIGTIARVGATSAVVYNTTSDQRLKSNITDANPVLDKLMTVKVRQFDWTEGDLHQDAGFIAQELEPILSGVVTKGKTEEDMWQLDYSRLTPYLVKAIQELKAEFDAYKATHP